MIGSSIQQPDFCTPGITVKLPYRLQQKFVRILLLPDSVRVHKLYNNTNITAEPVPPVYYNNR